MSVISDAYCIYEQSNTDHLIIMNTFCQGRVFYFLNIQLPSFDHFTGIWFEHKVVLVPV